jgi:uncharacterized protein YyaL (SSP411 family)
LLKEYIPHKVIMSGTSESNAYPLLSGKGNNGETSLYYCKNYACEKPVSTTDELLALLRSK